ncbi:MAG: sensor domain-containing diguanylate cyclase [Gallionella sp.]
MNMALVLPHNEVERLQAVNSYQLLDTLPEQAYDDLVQLAAYICQTPIALVSLIDESRQWFKARVGLDMAEVPRAQTFCTHALLEPEQMLLVNDARGDARFADHPAVLAGMVGFYAGVPLTNENGFALGTLCVVDSQARELSAAALNALSGLARQVVAQFELHKSVLILQAQQRDLLELNAQLTELSITDALTQLHNRRKFDQQLQLEHERAVRYPQEMSVLLLDIDHFKTYNDQFGHPAGDEVLRQVAKVIAGTVRPSDCAARYGGEEFVVILPETNAAGAVSMAERIRLAIEQQAWPLRPITTSIGVTTYRNQDVAQLVQQADAALYRAKQAGRNCVRVSE